MFITGIMAVLAGQVDILMIGAFLSPDKVGHYVIAVKVGLFSSFVLTALNILIAPKFAALHYEEKYDGLRKFGQKSATLVTFMTAPVFILVIFKGRELLGMFGLEFQTAYSSLVILVLTQALNILFGSTAYFMNMTGNSKVLNKVIVISTLTNVLLNILLIPVFGIDGAAFSSLVSTVLWNVVLTVFIHRKYGFFIGFNPFLLFKL